ncbi:hypothetical protein [Phyllobacterium endophyticum]|nr:hypothetical protein [Phyllobacterium endophyticum]MBB3237315.1 NADPH:quinone reductase-like Zn-dependent oxidoreductase [Phyllobacterium endophyticum]
MKALVLKEHGGIENFEIADLQIPKPRPSEVLVRIASASLNQIDTKIRGGLLIGPDLPA